MSRPKIPESRKKTEGAFVKNAFVSEQGKNCDLTQESLAEALGITQGLVNQYFKGLTNIPDERLIALGKILRFNPFELRPELVEKYLSSHDFGSSKLTQIYEALDPIAQERVMAYMLGQLEATQGKR